MPRVALSQDQQKVYKLNDFKGWIQKQMKLHGKRQADLAEVLGLSPGRISQMLEIPDPAGRKKVTEDPFSYGQVLVLCEYFGVDEEEKARLLTLNKMCGRERRTVQMARDKKSTTIAEYAIRRWLQERDLAMEHFTLEMHGNEGTLTDVNGDDIVLCYDPDTKSVYIKGMEEWG